MKMLFAASAHDRFWHFSGKAISLRNSLLIGLKLSSVLRCDNSRTLPISVIGGQICCDEQRGSISRCVCSRLEESA
jgi:hypothetical protein